jgi:hypothetical protein
MELAPENENHAHAWLEHSELLEQDDRPVFSIIQAKSGLFKLSAGRNSPPVIDGRVTV